jgi:di/tricarboxylate transporter
VNKGAGLIGKSIGEAEIGRRHGLEIVQVHRTAGFRSHYLDVRPGLEIRAGDELIVDGKDRDAENFAKEEALSIEFVGQAEGDRLMGRGINIAEVTFSPHSEYLGHTLADIGFRGRFGLSILAIWRRGIAIEEGIAELPMELGDALLIYGPIRSIGKLDQNPDIVFLDRQKTEEDVRRAPLALLLLAVALVPPVLGWFPLAVSALASALLMVATGCVSLQGARKSIDLRILFLIIGTVPLGDALFQTGVAGKLAATLFPAGSALGDFYVFGVLFAVSAILSTTSNNAAAAVILAPVAYAAAQSSGVEVGKAFLAVAYGASCAFVLPFAHQCNLMVMGPGGYKTKDFAKVGAGLSVLMAVTAVVLLTVL